jgi:hypothetical protein
MSVAESIYNSVCTYLNLWQDGPVVERDGNRVTDRPRLGVVVVLRDCSPQTHVSVAVPVYTLKPSPTEFVLDTVGLFDN